MANPPVPDNRPYVDRVLGLFRRPRGAANMIKTILYHPCADPWFCLVETFIPAALQLGITIFSPQWEDVLRGFAEHYNEIPGKHRRTRKGHAPGSRLSLDYNFGPVATNKLLTKTLFITQPLETFGWWLLIWNATDQFLSDWQSLLIKNNYCSRDPASGPYQRSDPAISGLFNPTKNALGISNLVQDRGGWGGNPFGVPVPGGSMFAILKGTFTLSPLLNDLEGCRLWIGVQQPVIGWVYYESEDYTIPAGGSVDMMVSAQFFALGVNTPVAWGTTGNNSVGAALGLEGNIMIMGLGK